jgi:cysteinyl-tRNA synthetase
MRYLGETFDIHGGGMENMFPHHECEIAQSEGVTQKPFVRVWMHNNMVTVNGVKMGKSLGNYTTIGDALREVDPQTLRLFVLNSHYRSVLDFSLEALSATGRGMERLRRTVQALNERCRTAPDREPDRAFHERLKEARRAFAEAMDDDFNTAQAVGALFDLTRDVNAALSAGTLGRKDLEASREVYAGLGEEVLGLDFREPGGASTGDEGALVELLLDLRQEFRAQKNWAMADRVRDRLAALGYLIEDGPHGARWSRRESSP